MPHPRSLLPLLAALLVLAPVAELPAQSPWYGGRGGWRPDPLREGLPERRDGFLFCRLLYTSVTREAMGHGWNTDYPASDRNLSVRLPQLTTTRVARWSDGEPGHAVVRPTDPELFECPFLFASDVGTAAFDDDEAERLREYLLKGGFLWVDDFWGERAWTRWTDQIRRVLPDAAIIELTPDHPLLSAVYVLPEVPQVPSIQYWRRSGGRTSERGGESARPRLYGIVDEHDRLIVLMSHNTDIADGWEREGEDAYFFTLFSPPAYALAVNIAVWMMTH